MQTLKRYFAEFLGTMLLVIFACGTAAATGVHSSEVNVAYLLTALAFGLCLAVLAACFDAVSGAHFNPAVSFASFLCGRISGWDFLGYVVSQCFGAIAGGAVLYGLFGRASTLGANHLYDASVFRTILVEAILTFAFVIVVLFVSAKKDAGFSAPLTLGAALMLVHVFGIPFTGTSVNPARSLGVALFVGGESLSSLWVFLLAPFLGALFAALFFRFFSPNCQNAASLMKTTETFDSKKASKLKPEEPEKTGSDAGKA